MSVAKQKKTRLTKEQRLAALREKYGEPTTTNAQDVWNHIVADSGGDKEHCANKLGGLMAYTVRDFLALNWKPMLSKVPGDLLTQLGKLLESRFMAIWNYPEPDGVQAGYDAPIGMFNVSIKLTMNDNYMIRPMSRNAKTGAVKWTALDNVFLFFKIDRHKYTFSVGLLHFTDLAMLTDGENGDNKKSLSGYGKSQVQYFIEDRPFERLPVSFVMGIPGF